MGLKGHSESEPEFPGYGAARARETLGGGSFPLIHPSGFPCLIPPYLSSYLAVMVFYTPSERADREGEGSDGSDPHFLGGFVRHGHRWKFPTAGAVPHSPRGGSLPSHLILAGRLGLSAFPEADLK